VGELCTKGYLVMNGYWNNSAKTAEAIDAGGWMHTGDLAGTLIFCSSQQLLSSSKRLDGGGGGSD
jgi:hypothetical protein